MSAPRQADADGEIWVRTGEVARILKVSTRAIADWTQAGRLPSRRTPGGHHQYPLGPIKALARDLNFESSEPTP